jgi:hypothetical protein
MIQSKEEYGYSNMLKIENLDIDCKERFTDIPSYVDVGAYNHGVNDENFEAGLQTSNDMVQTGLDNDQNINFSSIAQSLDHIKIENELNDQFKQAKEIKSMSSTYTNDKNILHQKKSSNEVKEFKKGEY